MAEFQQTYLPLLDFGSLGVAMPETTHGQTLQDVFDAFMSGEYMGELLAVFRVSTSERTVDVSNALAEMIFADSRRWEDLPEHAREFAQRHSTRAVPIDDTIPTHAEYVREHSALDFVGQGV